MEKIKLKKPLIEIKKSVIGNKYIRIFGTTLKDHTSLPNYCIDVSKIINKSPVTLLNLFRHFIVTKQDAISTFEQICSNYKKTEEDLKKSTTLQTGKKTKPYNACPFCNVKPMLSRANATTCGEKACIVKRIKVYNTQRHKKKSIDKNYNNILRSHNE